MLKAMRVPKSKDARIDECIKILKKMSDELDIPLENPGVAVLKKRMSEYWEHGRLEEERIPLVGSNRYILYRFPHWAHEQVEVVLRVGRITHQRLPASLVAELEAQTNSAPQSDPSCPSPLESEAK